MIVVDTSALIAILTAENEADACTAAIAKADDVLISAGTVAEALIVAERRGLADEMADLIGELQLQIIPVTAAVAHQIAVTYRKWGKGIHPAGLNFGDCFAYELAFRNSCALLYVGSDFSRTDLPGALAGR